MCVCVCGWLLCKWTDACVAGCCVSGLMCVCEQIVKKGTEKVVATGTLDLAQIATKGLSEFKVAN